MRFAKPTFYNSTKLNECKLIILRALKVQAKTFKVFLDIEIFRLLYASDKQVDKQIVVFQKFPKVDKQAS